MDEKHTEKNFRWSKVLEYASAKEGYSNFFIQINLYYTAESLSPKGEATLKKADWTLVYTKTGEPKAKNTIKSKQSLDVKNDLYLISADIFDEIKKAIKA